MRRVCLLVSCLAACTGEIGDRNNATEWEPGEGGLPPIETVCEEGVLPSASRVWRLSEEQLESVYQRAFGFAIPDGENPFEAITIATEDEELPFTNMSAVAEMPETVVRRLFALAPDVAASAADDARSRHACLADDPVGESCLHDALRPAVRLAVRRDADVVQTRLVALAQNEYAEGGDGLALAFASLAVAPEVLFRWEVVQRDVDSLSPQQLGEMLSFTLLDAPPSDELVDRIASGADLESEATALLGTAEGRSLMHRFIQEYFDYDRALNAFHDPAEDGYEHNREAVVESTRMWVDALLDQPDFLRNLLTSSEVYVNRDTAATYGVASDSAELVPVDVGPDQRSGILTHPSFLSYRSSSDRTDPVKRGHFVLTYLLCREIGGAPDDVPPFPEDPDRTVRERLSAHVSEANCAECHQHMDPLGLPFEQFDHFGRWRDLELGNPVDTTSEVMGTDFAGHISDPRDLTTKLADSEQVQSCFVQRAFEFVYGREIRAADACAIRDAQEQWASSDGSLQALLVALATSPAATTRSAPEGE